MIDQIIVRLRLEKVEGVLVTIGIFTGADEDNLFRVGEFELQREEWVALREGKGRFQVKLLEEMPDSEWYLEGRIMTEQSPLKYSMLDYLDVGYGKRSL